MEPRWRMSEKSWEMEICSYLVNTEYYLNVHKTTYVNNIKYTNAMFYIIVIFFLNGNLFIMPHV